MSNVLKTLRKTSIERAKEWRKKAPKKATKKQLRDFAAIELFGEVGELCNAIKKILRHDMGWVGGTDDMTNLKEEIGDVAISLDLLAQKYDIDLWEAIVEKFNKTSEKHGFNTRITHEQQATERTKQTFRRRCSACGREVHRRCTCRSRS